MKTVGIFLLFIAVFLLGALFSLPPYDIASAQSPVAMPSTSCHFTKGDQNPKALPYSSQKLVSYFKEVSAKTGVPATLLAGVARVESTTGSYTISNYTDADLQQMEDTSKILQNIDAKIPGTQKALCPRSPTGALGIMQIQPSESILDSMKLTNEDERAKFRPNAHSSDSVTNGARFIGKTANTLTIQDYCDPKTSLYLAAGFILKKMQGKGYGDGTKWEGAWNTDAKAFDAAASGYYGCLKYPSCQNGPNSYGDDLWQSFNSCKEENFTASTTTTTTSPSTSSIGGSMESNEVITRVGNPPISGGGNLRSILEWDTQIVSLLTVGNWGFLNRLPTAVSNGTYSTGVYSDSIYWCTFSIVDSYTLAGYKGLSKAAHGAVVVMRKFWQKAATEGTYTYVTYPTEGALAKVQPSYAMFMEASAGNFTGSEHVAMVKEIVVDSRGNGYLISQDSNSSARTHKFTVVDGQVIGTVYPVRGFGGVEGTSEEGTDASGIFAQLPGTHSAYAILPNGSIADKNGSVSQPAFSMIKLWVAAALMEAVESGKISLSSTYTMSESDKQYGGTGIIVRGGTGNTLTYEQYLNYMLVYSDNIATNVIINSVGGISAVNSYIQRNGYPQTRLQRLVGTTTYSSANDNYSSAKDGATFMKNLIENTVVSPAASQKIISILQERTNKKQDGIYLGKSLSPTAQFVGKSGVGGKTRNDAGSFNTKSGQPVYMSIMITDLSNEPAGEEAIGKAANAASNLAQ